MSRQQHTVMAHDPGDGAPCPFPSHADQYRDWHKVRAWLFSPWTGEPRRAEDVGTDTFGHLIIPPGEPVYADAPPAPNVDAMVDRFLCWPLPKTFAPDCGISFDGRKDDEWNKNKNKTWPVGTNLFTADEARAMFEHALGVNGKSSAPTD